mmetsp:Transcript_95116/g.269259  ORF Transcript_95116/g.269259 Transcript_95116/m.269259 type:complete len:616 (+) Transcript_95116:61-1908(+)
MESGSLVEVRLRKQSHTWCQGRIRDVNADRDHIVVCFESGTLWYQEVETSQVRRPPAAPRDLEGEEWRPQLDEAVEVMKPAVAPRPVCWTRGVVRMVREPYLYVSALGDTREQDVIVRRERVRRVSTEVTLDQAPPLRREVVKVAKPLAPWVESEDAVGCLTQVRIKAGLLNASTQETEDGSMVIVLIGDTKSAELGRKLLCDVHLKHQAEIQRCQDKVLRLEDKLMECEDRATDAKVEFSIEDGLVGRIIGKNGHNLMRTQDKFNVRIEVLEARPPREPTKRVIRITGQSTEDVEAARRSIEFIQVSVPLAEDQIGWILGKGFNNIQDIARKAELIYARFNPRAYVLELCGLHDSVESAKLLVEAHADYLQVYKEMDQEQIEMHRNFKRLVIVEDAMRKRTKGGKGANAVKGPIGARKGDWPGQGGCATVSHSTVPGTDSNSAHPPGLGKSDSRQSGQSPAVLGADGAPKQLDHFRNAADSRGFTGRANNGSITSSGINGDGGEDPAAARARRAQAPRRPPGLGALPEASEDDEEYDENEDWDGSEEVQDGQGETAEEFELDENEGGEDEAADEEEEAETDGEELARRTVAFHLDDDDKDDDEMPPVMQNHSWR